MQTLDCLFSGMGEMTVVVTGVDAPPVVTNRDTGACVYLEPAQISHSIVASIMFAGGPPNGAWIGELPIAPDAEQVRFALAADGTVRTGTVRRKDTPAPAPEPAPAATSSKPRARARRR